MRSNKIRLVTNTECANKIFLIYFQLSQDDQKYQEFHINDEFYKYFDNLQRCEAKVESGEDKNRRIRSKLRELQEIVQRSGIKIFCTVIIGCAVEAKIRVTEISL